MEILIRSEVDDDIELRENDYDYIRGISRGRLLLLDTATVNIVRYNYVIVNNLIKTDRFKSARNQRLFVMNTTLDILQEDEVHLQFESCENGHSLEKIEKMIVWASTNSFLNNFCRRENDSILAKKSDGNSGKKEETYDVAIVLQQRIQ